MRLPKQNKKRTIIIIAVILAVVILAAVGILLFANPGSSEEERKPDDIIGIELSSKPTQTVYFLGEPFKPEGAKIQVLTHDFTKSYFLNHSQVHFSGFDSSSVGEKVITVTYKGFTTTFTVTVKEPESASPVLTSIRMGDSFQTTYTIEDWNNFGPKVNNATLVLVYSDGSEKEVGMKRGYCSNINDVSSAGTAQFTVTYVDAGIVVSTTVTVTITE